MIAGMDHNPAGDFHRELAMDDIAAETLKQNVLSHALFVSAFFLTCFFWVVVHFKSPLAGIFLSFLTIGIGLSATELTVRVRSKVPLVVLFDLVFAYFQWKGPWACPTGQDAVKTFHQTWQRRGLLVTAFLAGNILWTGLKRDSGRDQIHVLMFFLVVLLAVETRGGSLAFVFNVVVLHDVQHHRCCVVKIVRVFPRFIPHLHSQ